ncbi:MAG TPA: hypothetical protein VNA89_00905 [Gemmatimonadaceae bacterium]|nr:hypothetical protein [Gemmatimonadaceae bacterium]
MARSTGRRKPIAILHEHPDWFRPLFAELDRRGVPYIRLDAASHLYDPAERAASPADAPYALVFNRASPSAYLRGHGGATFHTLHWLRHVERQGIPVVNGPTAYGFEISKADQASLLASLGLPHPATRVINDPRRAVEAARGLRWPVIVKANVGGSGAGIVRYDDEASLARAAAAGTVPMGVDAVALVQEAMPMRGGHITRVETLGGRFLYAINVFPAEDSFNLCPADVCQTTDGRALERAACPVDAPKNGMRVERAAPSPEIVAQVEAISRAARIDVGGIEYLVDDRDGRHYFYDVNALSNFVADAPNVVGFDPWVRLVDYLEERLSALGSRLSAKRAVAASRGPMAEGRSLAGGRS